MSRDKNSLPPDIEGINFKIVDNSPLVRLPPPENGFEFIVSRPFTNHTDSANAMSSIQPTSILLWRGSEIVSEQTPENS